MSKGAGGCDDGKVPVLTRITNVKFKRAVLPGDTLDIEVTMKEKIGPAFYLAGKVKVDSKTVLTIEFSGMIVDETL